MDKYLTAFLIGFSLMFAGHYMLEPTWGVNEPRPRRIRMIANYSFGVIGIAIAFLYLHIDHWLDLLVCIGGAGSATILAHSRDSFFHLLKRDQAHGLIEESKDKA